MSGRWRRWRGGSCLFDDEVRVRPCGGEGCGLGHSGRADFLLDNVGRILEARRFAAQFLGGEEPRRHAEVGGGGMNGGLV